MTDGDEAAKKLEQYKLDAEQKRLDIQPRITPEMIELDLKISKLNVELNKPSSGEYAALERRIDRLKDNSKIQLEFIEKVAETARRKYYSACDRFRSYNDHLDNYQKSQEKLIDQTNYYMAQIREKRSELDSIVQQIENAEEAKKAIKSYLSCSFDDALESIGNMATEILRNIPNMATATISLEGIKENANGKIKEEVNFVISKDGEIGIPVKSLSGGEESSTFLALDLAAVSFIEEKTGQGINIMGLDEFTNGLDTPCIQEVMEMLRNLKLDKKILLVEHNPIVSKSIENKIIVERTGLKSRIIQGKKQ